MHTYQIHQFPPQRNGMRGNTLQLEQRWTVRQLTYHYRKLRRDGVDAWNARSAMWYPVWIGTFATFVPNADITDRLAGTGAIAEELAGDDEIPGDWPVQPLGVGAPMTADVATCGECGRSWNDRESTSMTPAPSGRCPFEYFHDI